MNALPKKYWRYRRQAMDRRQFGKNALAAAVTSLLGGRSWGRNPRGMPTGVVPPTNPLGTNVAASNYYVGTVPYLNLFKQALSGGSYAGNSTRWITQSTLGSGTDTDEEAYLQLDSDGYPTSLTASPTPVGGQVFTVVQTILCLSQTLGTGCTTTYMPDTYRLKFIGQGTVQVTGDGAKTLSNASASTYVTGTFTVTPGSSGFLRVGITSITSGTDYPRDISIVPVTYTTSFDAGAIYHPYFLAQIANFTSLRFMQSSGAYGAYTTFSPQNYPISSGVTSITLGDGAGTAKPWLFPTQTRKLYFIDGEVFNATFTLGSATVALNGTLANSIGSSTYNTQLFYCACLVSWVDTFSQRSLPSNASWAPNNHQTMPLEVQIALCNQQNADFYFNIPPTVTLADAALWIQAIINGTGLQAGWSALNSNLKVRVEYANETWTETAFEQLWMTLFGTAQWYPAQGTGSPATVARNWFGYYTIAIANAMKTSLGSTVFNARVIPVIGAQGQTGNSASVTQALWSASSYWSGSSASNTIIKAIAIADYWPTDYTGWISVADATTLVANGLTDFFLLATTNTPPSGSGGSGHTYTSVSALGYLGYMQSLYSGWTTLAATYNIISYEGNTSFVASDYNGVRSTLIASASQTVASPGVFNTAAQTLTAGQPVILTSAAPGGFSVNTTYYVIAAGLTTTTCQLSATLGGTGIQCTASASCGIQKVVLGYGALVNSAMHDPRMQTLYTSYLNGWPFGNTQANIRHVYQDCQSLGNPVTSPSYEGAFNLLESTMQMSGSVSLSVGKYYKWAAAQAYLA